MHLKRQLSEQGGSPTLSCWRYSKIWNLQQQWLEEVEAVSLLQDVAFTKVAIVSEEVVVAQEQDLPKLAWQKNWREIYLILEKDCLQIWCRQCRSRLPYLSEVCTVEISWESYPFTCLPLVGRKSMTTLWTNDVWATVKWFRSTEAQEDAFSCANQYPVNDTDRIKKLEEELGDVNNKTLQAKYDMNTDIKLPLTEEEWGEWRQSQKVYGNRVNKHLLNQKKASGIIIGQCTQHLQDKLHNYAQWKLVNRKPKTIRNVHAHWESSNETDRDQYPSHNLVDNLLAVFTLKQQNNPTCWQYWW